MKFSYYFPFQVFLVSLSRLEYSCKYFHRRLIKRKAATGVPVTTQYLQSNILHAPPLRSANCSCLLHPSCKSFAFTWCTKEPGVPGHVYNFTVVSIDFLFISYQLTMIMKAFNFNCHFNFI